MLDVSNLPTLPRDWIWAPLSLISNILGGFAFKSKHYTRTGFQIVKIGNVKMGKLLLTKKSTFIEKINEDIKEKFL